VEIADAKALVKAGVTLVAEGANMPSDSEAIEHFHKNKVEFAPAKAANAGGVAVSGLEMCQNSARLSWTREEVDEKLKVCHPLSATPVSTLCSSDILHAPPPPPDLVSPPG